MAAKVIDGKESEEHYDETEQRHITVPELILIAFAETIKKALNMLKKR